MAEERKSFIIYLNYAKQFRRLSMDQRGALITAIFEYAESGEVLTELDPLTDMAFSMMQDTFDRDKQSYIKKCEKNSDNGKKGGRPKKSEKSERFFEKTKKADNDNENENDNDNENENENENEIDKDKDKESDNDNELDQISRANGEDCSARPSAPCSARPSAPCSAHPSAPCSAPLKNSNQEITEADFKFLKCLGIPEEYIEERSDRAIEHAKKHKRKASRILIEWWGEDKDEYERSSRASSESSYAFDGRNSRDDDWMLFLRTPISKSESDRLT